MVLYLLYIEYRVQVRSRGSSTYRLPNVLTQCFPTLGSVDLAILLPRAEILSPGVLKKSH